MRPRRRTAATTPPGTAEQQLLVSLRQLELDAPEGSAEGGVQSPGEIEEEGRRLFAGGWAPQASTRRRLAARGLVETGAGGVRLTAAGRRCATALRRRHLAAGMSQVLVDAAESAAYAELCRRAAGLAWSAFDLLDGEQLRWVAGALALAPGERLLDAGCGTGAVGRHLAAVAGARAVGLDLAIGALRWARRAAPTPRYAAGDLVALPFAEGSFDAVLSIDALPFADPLTVAVDELLRVVRPGGRLVVVVSERLAGERRPPAAALARGSRLGRALAGRGVAFSVRDLSHCERRLWRRQHELLPALEARFAAEGHHTLWRRLSDEARRGVELAAEDALRRILYRVQAGRTASGSPAGSGSG